MRIFKAGWLRHGSERDKKVPSVNSLDFQPARAAGGPVRLATAGEDCQVRLWSVDRLETAAQGIASGQATVQQSDNAQGSEALLAILKEHTQAVNCVRWSPDGEMLASAGSDILTHVLRSQESFGSKESWSCLRPFRGHSSDVIDLAWSPDSVHLVSASMDTTMLVFNARNEQQVASLRSHTGFVKGVSWDPMGRYIASQALDNSVIIWRSSDWKPETVLSKTFQNPSQENSMVFYTRLSWSPSGLSLLTTNAHKLPSAHVATVFSRDSNFSEKPKDTLSFVGHGSPVVVGKYSPRLFYPSGETTTAEYLALGSTDQIVSIWRSSAAAPLVTTEGLFQESVTDLSWTSDGLRLAASSEDGTVAYLCLTEGDLGGKLVDVEEQKSIFNDIWQGRGGQANVGKKHVIPESAAMLPDEEKVLDVNNASRLSQVVVHAQETQIPGIDQKHDATPPVAQPSRPKPVLKRPAQREERAVGGKRRIIPQQLASNGDGPNPSESAKFQAPTPVPVSVRPEANPRPVVQAERHTDRRKRASAATEKPPIRSLGRTSPVVTTEYSPIPQNFQILSVDDTTGVKSLLLEGADPQTTLDTRQHRGAVWMLTSHKGSQIRWRDLVSGGGIVAMSGVADRFAAVATADSFLIIYSGESGRRLTPPILLEAPAHLLQCGHDRFLLVVTASAQCRVFDLEKLVLVSSRSAAPLLVRPQAIPESGENRLRSNYRSISVARVTHKGEPLLMLSDGHSFVFDQQLLSWVRIADDHSPGSEMYTSQMNLLGPQSGSGAVEALQVAAAKASPLVRSTMLGNSDPRRGGIETVSHLENLMTSSLILNSPAEYTYYLTCYVTKLASGLTDERDGGCLGRIRDLCDLLLGIGFNGKKRKPTHLDPEAVGFERHELLEHKVLPILRQNTSLQRIVTEYTESLKEIRLLQPAEMPAQ